jgi:hypothetical protein
VLGQTWVGHYGTNHKQSTRIAIVAGPGSASDPARCEGRVGAGRRLRRQADLRRDFDDGAAAQRHDARFPCRHHEAADAERVDAQLQRHFGKEGRVFTSLYGTSEDITNEGYRRLLVNGIFWSLGLEDKIKPDLNIAFVGAAKPNTFGGGAYARGIKPEMYAGFESPIPANNNTKKPEDEEGRKQASSSGLH